jgi:hypothetical protein
MQQSMWYWPNCLKFAVEKVIIVKLQWYGMYRNTIISAVLQCNVLQFMLTSRHRQKYHLVTTDKSNTVHCYTLIKTILHVMPTLWQCSWCYNKKICLLYINDANANANIARHIGLKILNENCIVNNACECLLFAWMFLEV